MVLRWVVLVFLVLSYIPRDTGSKVCEEAEQHEKNAISEFLQMTADLLSKVKDTQPEHDQQLYPCPKHPVDCAGLRKCGHNTSGVYEVYPRSRVVGEDKKTLVYCDMTTDDGGWLVIQRRGDYGRTWDYFQRSWDNYKGGFGILTEDFWLGNDKIFGFTNMRKYQLRFELKDFEGEERYAFYESFWIDDEDHNYTLHVKGYSGNAGDSFEGIHNGMMFTTFDRDNDESTTNCADNCGGWWFKDCSDSTLNGPYLRGLHEPDACGVEWFTFKGLNYSLAATEMKIRSVHFKPEHILPSQ